MPPFSRYNPMTHPNVKTAFKIPKGSVLKYVPGQGYTTAVAPAVRAKAAAAAVAPPGGVPPAAGVQPFSYGDTLKNEGIFAAESAGIGAENDAARAQRDAAVKGMQFQYNDPANPYSTVGELGRNHDRAQAEMVAGRAARGVMSSGGTRLGSIDIAHDYGLGSYNALNDVTGRIGGLDAGLAETLRVNKGRLGQALTDAQGRLIDNGIGPPVGGVGAPSGAPGPGGTVPTDAATRAAAANAALTPGQTASDAMPITTPGWTGRPDQDPAYLARKAAEDKANFLAWQQQALHGKDAEHWAPWQYNTSGYLGVGKEFDPHGSYAQWQKFAKEKGWI